MGSLYKAMTLIKDEKLMEAFLKDICTPQELSALKERFKIAQLLYHENLSYREIHQKSKASLTTIGRVARFLKDEPYQGYKEVLELLKANQ